MFFLDYTGDAPCEALALDEALLDTAEQRLLGPTEILRIWELRRPTVVVGRSSRVAVEVRLDECRRDGVDVVRRTSGGAAVVVGPGCLLYSVILSYDVRPQLRDLSEAHRFVLDRVLDAVHPYVADAVCCGTSDLARDGRKFSGNSLRCRRRHLLYHGTMLYDFPLALAERYLGTPPRQPEYRAARRHRDFLTNVAVPRADFIAGLRTAFAADVLHGELPCEAVRRLAAEKYGNSNWNLQP